MRNKVVLTLLITSTSFVFAQETSTSNEQLAPQEVAPTPQDEVTLLNAAPVSPTPADQTAAHLGEELPAPEVPAIQPAVTSPEPVVPQEPAAPEFITQPAPEPSDEDDIEIKGIDTVDINDPKGNWLYKRLWWEKAERLYEKIKQLSDKINEYRITFYTRRHELNHATLDPFYFGLGMEQGELGEIISHFTQQLEQQKEVQGTLDEKQQQLLDTISQEKATLDQLLKDSDSVNKIDRAIDDALMKLVDQLSQAQNYEHMAWENFKAINKELSDKKARELYYGMDTYWRNLNSINSYLSDAFTKYFEQLVVKAEDQTQKIKTVIGGLKEKGIDILLQAQKIKTTCKVSPESSDTSQEPEEPSGILGTLWSWIKSPFVLVGSLFSGAFDWVGGLFGGSSSDIVALKPARGATNEATNLDVSAQEDQE